MVCIYCSSALRVANSRPQKSLNQVWRRRQCDNCKARFTSIEVLDYTGSLVVQDSTDRLVPFLRDELFVSILKSCQHRPDALTSAAGLAATAITRLCALPGKGITSTGVIAETTLDILRHYDTAAAVHYEAYHRALLWKIQATESVDRRNLQ